MLIDIFVKAGAPSDARGCRKGPAPMAKDGIIIYSSQTGYTKRYAEFLAEQLNYDIKPVRKANLFRVSCYPVVIYGGGLHHNRIDGIRGLVDGYEYLGDQTLIVFSVGLSSVNDDIIRDIKRRNLPDFLQENVFFKALPGGLARKDTLPGATMAHKVDFYREKREEGKTLTRGDMIALAIADGKSPDQNRYDEGEAGVIVNAARRHV